MTTSHPIFPPFSIEDARKQVGVEVVTYGEEADQLIEFYGDSSLTTKTIVFIHGGYWRNIFDREHLRPLGVALAKAGHYIAIPEFARSAGNPEITIRDLSAALTAMSNRKLTLIGYSSGGHLALVLANSFPAVDYIIGLAPVTDLVESQARELGRGAVLEWLGCNASERPDVDPMLRPPVTSRVRFIQGSADERVPLDITEKYVAAMKSHGQEIEFEVLPGTTHFEMMDVPSVTLGAILNAIN